LSKSKKTKSKKALVKMICYSCVQEIFLQSEIKEKGKETECSYCKSLSNCYSISYLSKRIEGVIIFFYEQTNTFPDNLDLRLDINEILFPWEREGEPITTLIQNIARVSQETAADIQWFLEQKYVIDELLIDGIEPPFYRTSHYKKTTPNTRGFLHVKWHFFQYGVKHQSRHFNPSHLSFLRKIFGDLDNLSATNGKSIIVAAGPDGVLTNLYRARVFQDDEKLKIALSHPDVHLAAPPSSISRSGRMNAHGISVFYGATSPEVALAEVRPPVGSRVAVARFKITRKLRLLDLNALDAVVGSESIFDENYKAKAEKANFLFWFGKFITRPIMPDDESFDYLPTQAIADFLATSRKIDIDGIIFRSAQRPGNSNNVVLFHKASRCEPIFHFKGTKINTNILEDVNFYEVNINVPKNKEILKMPFSGLEFYVEEETEKDANDWRSPMLAIETDFIVVHHIKSVEIKSDAYDVLHVRTEI